MLAVEYLGAIGTMGEVHPAGVGTVVGEVAAGEY
jgi:hypothetical protein